MRTEITITSIILICFSLVGIIFILSQIPNVTGTIKTENIQSQSINKHLDYYPAMEDYYWIEMLAETNSASHEYKLHVYDCTQFSKNLVKELKANGYKAQCTAGHTPNWDYPDHTWVSVWIGEQRFEIEATSGYFISEEDYKNDYVKVWENKCW